MAKPDGLAGGRDSLFLGPPQKLQTDPGKAWLTEAKHATPSLRDWKREHEIDFTVTAGKPFFDTLNRDVHVRDLTYDRTLPLLRGWDFGRRHPACIWAQLTKDNRMHVLHSLMETNKNIFVFTPLVVAETNARFPGAQIADFGDLAGAQETDAHGALSCRDRRGMDEWARSLE
ncbi:MAG: hypothetical protein GKS05_09025 [Nitrospirales bacterium]|nr:hypothetical protein [Nitrospirales bacterium]